MLRTGIETIICLSPNFLYVYVYVLIIDYLINRLLVAALSSTERYSLLFYA